MWPGRAVSLIDRPWVPCPSASWQDLVSEGPPIAGRGGGEKEWDGKSGRQSEWHLQVYGRIYRAGEPERRL